MGNNVIPFRRREGATDSEKAASGGSRIMVQVGRQRYAIHISCAATALAAEADLAAERPPRVPQVETKFLRLRQPARWRIRRCTTSLTRMPVPYMVLKMTR
jgi:hypothetical protein